MSFQKKHEERTITLPRKLPRTKEELEKIINKILKQEEQRQQASGCECGVSINEFAIGFNNLYDKIESGNKPEVTRLTSYLSDKARQVAESCNINVEDITKDLKKINTSIQQYKKTEALDLTKKVARTLKENLETCSIKF